MSVLTRLLTTVGYEVYDFSNFPTVIRTVILGKGPWNGLRYLAPPSAAVSPTQSAFRLVRYVRVFDCCGIHFDLRNTE
jgi:hypothetical protein